MPIYEYQCQACGHEFEAMQKMSEDALTDCPECSKPELKKLISAAGFQLKGTGWYATDFKDGGKKKDSGGSSSGGSKSGASGGGCGAGGCGCVGH
ncbi:MAG: zinc ribbon domain-containing protein [Gammaproteobacteria bacterium]|nr:zinc ribbon domain-containing protein [Gammaproteobacteria bacterium]